VVRQVRQPPARDKAVNQGNGRHAVMPLCAWRPRRGLR
jgi:hypothetical protein